MKLTISVPRVTGGVCLNSLRRSTSVTGAASTGTVRVRGLVVSGSSSCVEALRGVRCQSSPVSLIGGAFHEVRLVCQPVGRWGRKFPRGMSGRDEGAGARAESSGGDGRATARLDWPVGLVTLDRGGGNGGQVAGGVAVLLGLRGRGLAAGSGRPSCLSSSAVQPSRRAAV